MFCFVFNVLLGNMTKNNKKTIV